MADPVLSPPIGPRLDPERRAQVIALIAQWACQLVLSRPLSPLAENAHDPSVARDPDPTDAPGPLGLDLCPPVPADAGPLSHGQHPAAV